MRARKLDFHRSWLPVPLVLFLLLMSQAYPGIAPAFAADDAFEALQAGRFAEPLSIPDFNLPAVSGNEVKLSDFKGNVIFLNFWATWCPYCRQERPSLQALYEKYKANNFVVVAVSIDRAHLDTVKQYVQDHQLTFPNLHDQFSEVARQYGVVGIPATLFIDPQGNALGGVIGPRVWDSKEAFGVVEHLLPKPN